MKNKARSPPPRKTEERVKLEGQSRARVVYVGSRGGWYIQEANEFKLLKKGEYEVVRNRMHVGGVDAMVKCRRIARIVCASGTTTRKIALRGCLRNVWD